MLALAFFDRVISETTGFMTVTCGPCFFRVFPQRIAFQDILA